MRIPDVLLDNVGVFDWFKPLDKSIDIVDKLVEDKDLRNELRAELQRAEMDLRKLAEQTYIAELQVKTIPWIDATHKMGRQILSLLNLIIPPITVIILAYMDIPLTEKHMVVLGVGSAATVAYNTVKGKGNPTQ